MADDNTKNEEDEAVVDDEEDEEDLEKLQAEIERMEAEAARISKETEELEKKKESIKSSTSGDNAAGGANKDDSKPTNDACSIYVGQVDYSTTPEELVSHFGACGTVERVTIVCDKYTGRPKGESGYKRVLFDYVADLSLLTLFFKSFLRPTKGFAYIEFQVKFFLRLFQLTA